MLLKKKLRALSPGQWARITIPDYDCWKKNNENNWSRAKPGDEIDICIMPVYRPRYDSENYFEWCYQVAWRWPGSTSTNYSSGTGYWVSPWDLGLIDPTHSSPNWDEHTMVVVFSRAKVRTFTSRPATITSCVLAAIGPATSATSVEIREAIPG